MRANSFFLSFSLLLTLFSWVIPSANADSYGLKGVVTNGNVIISWPMLPGKWDLLTKPYSSGDWLPVPPLTHQTNGARISVTLPLGNTAMLYRVKRSFEMSIPALPNFPKVPPPPTNRPPPRPSLPK